MRPTDEAVETVRRALREASADLGESERGQWLRTIYESRADRFASAHQAIWRTGGIIVPISFASLVIPVQGRVTSGWALIALALASVLVLTMWVVIRENLNAHQEKSAATMQVIELEALGFREPFGPDSADRSLWRIVTRPGALKWFYRSAPLVLALVWSLVFIGIAGDLRWTTAW